MSARANCSRLLAEVGPPSSIALSSNGTSLAAGNHEGEITIWDSAPGEDPTILTGHRGAVKCLAYSGNDLWLASGGADRTIRLWKGRQFKTALEGHKRGITCVAFSPDGKTLASGSADETVKIWDLESGAEKTPAALRERHKRGAIIALELSRDGTNLVIATPDVVQVWDVINEQRRFQLETKEKGAVWWSARYSPAGAIVAIGSGAKYDHAIRISTKQGVSTGSHHPEDNEIAVWDVQTGREIARLRGHHDSVRATALSSDGAHLASGSRDLTIRIWDVARKLNPSYRPAIIQTTASVSPASMPFETPTPAAETSQSNPSAEGAREEALKSLQLLTEPSSLAPASGLLFPESSPSSDEPSMSDSDDASFIWGSLLQLMEIKDLFRPDNGSSSKNENKNPFRGPINIPRSVPVASPDGTTASHAGDFESTPPRRVVERDVAGWSRRESSHTPSSSFGQGQSIPSSAGHDRSMGAGGGGGGGGHDHHKNDHH
jgi:hypothetical protein